VRKGSIWQVLGTTGPASARSLQGHGQYHVDLDFSTYRLRSIEGGDPEVYVRHVNAATLHPSPCTIHGSHSPAHVPFLALTTHNGSKWSGKYGDLTSTVP
jgi:hypothetical protein